MTYEICINCAKQNYKGLCPIMKGYMEMKGEKNRPTYFSCKEYEKPKE